MENAEILATAEQIAAEHTKISQEKPNAKRRFFDIVFLIGFICCLIPGLLPSLSTIASAVFVLCIIISFFDENFYLYAALLMYMRYKMLIGGTPAIRIYSYLVVIRFLIELPKTKFRITYLPTLVIFVLHSLFATAKFETLRAGLYVVADFALIYIVLLYVLSDAKFMRKFMFAFLLGGVASGIYGWANSDVSVDINVSGAGAHTVNRNFGALSDANFAGLFYSLCIICTLVLKNIPIWLKAVFIAIFGLLLLQTASLSALLVLSVLSVFLIILKYRRKSVFIITLLLAVAVAGIAIILSVPQLREIEEIAGLIIRIEEKLSYIPRGRWDLLTTDRWSIWNEAIELFTSKSLWGKLIGGSVLTVTIFDTSVMDMACHNSYLQSILNFGVLGTLVIYIPLLAVFIYRIGKHFTQKSGYETEDIKMLQLLFSFAFIVFGMTVDFFIDWPYMMLYFI